MHNNIDISIDQLSKIEGHATLDIKVRNGHVELVKLQITENKRFYTQAIKGKHFLSAPQLMSRICGTCSIAHLLCCIRAVEDALKVKVSRQTEILRMLSMHGMYIRDHALHLYLFSLPDVLGKDSLLDLDENNPEERKWLEEAFALKGAGNRLSQVIAGRAVHAPFPVVGGHIKIPEQKEIEGIVAELKRVRPLVFNAMRTFMDCPFKFERKTNFVSVSGRGFAPYGGKVKTSRGMRFSQKSYAEYLEQVIIPYSQAVGYTFKEKDYMLGSLARLNLNMRQLNKKTRKDSAEFLKEFPSDNVYRNNLAQAIEVLHSIDESIGLLEKTRFIKEDKAQIIPKTGVGVATIEAPRGILFYKLRINEKGIIEDAAVVVPTQQNQIKMELDIKDIVEANLDKEEGFLQAEVEKLIRAYDPCMSCASHFLRINWI